MVPRPGTSKAAPGHRIHPYLLPGLAIIEPNHVWASDITRAKGRSSHRAQMEFPDLRKRYWGWHF